MRKRPVAVARGVTALLLVVTLISPPLAGQRADDLAATAFWRLSDERGRATSRSIVESRQRAPDHRYEGAIVGGLLFGVGGALVVGALCGSSDDSDNCTWAGIKGGVFLGALGGLAGALIGGLFPKGRPATQDSMPYGEAREEM